MAFKISARALVPLPTSLEGLYLFPYEWFKYGLENGHIIIEDLEFYDTIQGSMLLALDSERVPKMMIDEESGVYAPIWYLYQSGSGSIVSTVDPEVNRNDAEVAFINDGYLKTPVIYCSVSNLSRLSKNDQKSVNNSIIQLFKGCKVKLKHSVWFV